jgi:hypothetical protein
MSAPTIDFARPTPTAWLGWIVLALGVAALGTALRLDQHWTPGTAVPGRAAPATHRAATAPALAAHTARPRSPDATAGLLARAVDRSGLGWPATGGRSAEF